MLIVDCDSFYFINEWVTVVKKKILELQMMAGDSDP